MSFSRGDLQGGDERETEDITSPLRVVQAAGRVMIRVREGGDLVSLDQVLEVGEPVVEDRAVGEARVDVGIEFEHLVISNDFQEIDSINLLFFLQESREVRLPPGRHR